MGKPIISQKRGKGSTTYRSPGHRSKGETGYRFLVDETVGGVVLDLVNCPMHASPLMVVEYEDGELSLTPAPEGIRVGQSVVAGDEMAVGNCLQLKDIPEGTLISNIEGMPGDGGKFVKSGGASARVATKTKNKVAVILPSKKQKLFIDTCRATVGTVAGSGRVEKPLLKAGKAYHKYRVKNKLYPITSAGAMNAVDHPFGNKRSSRKAKVRVAPRDAPPGRKVGMIRARRTGKKK